MMSQALNQILFEKKLKSLYTMDKLSNLIYSFCLLSTFFIIASFIYIRQKNGNELEKFIRDFTSFLFYVLILNLCLLYIPFFLKSKTMTVFYTVFFFLQFSNLLLFQYLLKYKFLIDIFVIIQSLFILVLLYLNVSIGMKV